MSHRWLEMSFLSIQLLWLLALSLAQDLVLILLLWRCCLRQGPLLLLVVKLSWCWALWVHLSWSLSLTEIDWKDQAWTEKWVRKLKGILRLTFALLWVALRTCESLILLMCRSVSQVARLWVHAWLRCSSVRWWLVRQWNLDCRLVSSSVDLVLI